MEENNQSEIDAVEWKSCCFNLDKDFVKFFVQVAISLMILSLSIYKLIIITDSDDDKSLYVSLLTLILGIYTNVPSVKVKKTPYRSIEP
jgi:hypothetical protein